MNFHHLIPKLLILIITQTRWTNSEGFYDTCSRSFSCGTISGIQYPFRRHQDPPECGYPGFELNCDQNNLPTINITNITYRVLGIDPATQILKLVRGDMINSCPQDLVNTTINHQLFDYTQSYMNISFLIGCPIPFDVEGMISSFFCSNIGINPVILVPGATGPGVCKTSVVIPSPVGFTGLVEVLQDGFEVKWKSNSKVNKNDVGLSPPSSTSSPGSNGVVPKPKRKWKLVAGVLSGIIGFMFLLFMILYQLKKLRAIKKAASHIETYIRNNGTLSPKRFTYSEIKKMTNSFLEKLGQGGYGSVYKGQLMNGQLVAVKLLAGAHRDGEDFINEVASISRTSHVNIVTLLGFCIEGKKRALLYEFLPNGSLDTFLRGDESHLDWKTLFQIAKGIARGLEYLHQGCNTRIVHFDIKPHNILLDEEFVPKISDFGLAKLCKRKESIFSLTGVRGTPGYMAPEVFFRSLGGASHKSDVYSYGMMVLEMTGARKHKNTNSTSTSEAYFPDWIYKQVEVGGNLGDCGVTSQEEEELARKLMIVSLWCIQSDLSDRPSIDKVVEMLEGNFESLQVPPRCVKSSHARPFQGTTLSSTQSITSERVSKVHAVAEDISSSHLEGQVA